MGHFFRKGTCRVLAIEDEEGVRSLYRRTLSSLFDVNTADSLATAEALLRSGAEFDALILDLGMAGEDTADFWLWLCDTRPSLASATLIISGQTGEDRFKSVVNARAGWVLQKPFNSWELRDHLWSLLGQDENDERHV